MIEFWYGVVDILPFEWVRYAFMKNALLTILLASPLFALLGCLVISNQMSFFSEAMGHAALTGIAIGVLLGVADPTWSMIAFSLLLAVAVTGLRNFSTMPTDTIIGLMLAAVVALGVVILSRSGGFGRYSGFLVGDILTLSPGAIGRLALMLAVVLLLWVGFFNKFLLVSLSRSLARSRGISIWGTELVFASLVAVVVTVSIQWMGLLVINAFLILPAAVSRNVAWNTGSYVWIAMGVSVLSGVLGLISSYYWDTAAGATMVIYAAGFFLLSMLLRNK